MGFDADELLGSMVDTHCHVQNDTSDDPLQTETTKDLIWSCREGGMRGVVLKAHGWPAVRLARDGYELPQCLQIYFVFSLPSYNACFPRLAPSG